MAVVGRGMGGCPRPANAGLRRAAKDGADPPPQLRFVCIARPARRPGRPPARRDPGLPASRHDRARGLAGEPTAGRALGARGPRRISGRDLQTRLAGTHEPRARRPSPPARIDRRRALGGPEGHPGRARLGSGANESHSDLDRPGWNSPRAQAEPLPRRACGRHEAAGPLRRQSRHSRRRGSDSRDRAHPARRSADSLPDRGKRQRAR